MNNFNSQSVINNPRLIFYGFHLRNDLFQVVDEANSLWQQCSDLGKQKQHYIERLESIPRNLINYREGKNQPDFEDKYAKQYNQSTDELKLLVNDELRHFKVTFQPNGSTIRGTVDPFRLHDVYVLDLTLRYADSNRPREISELSFLNFLPSKLKPSLGRSLILIAEPLDNQENYSSLADKCVKALLQATNDGQDKDSTNSSKPDNIFGVSGQLFGSPIFEYEITLPDSNDLGNNIHILVWFHRYEKTKEFERKTYWDLLQLLCCRHKIIYAYHEARWCIEQAKKIYGELEKSSQSLNILEIEAALNLAELKILLSKIPLQSFQYTRYLRDLQVHQMTINTNAENYQLWVKALEEKVQEFANDVSNPTFKEDKLDFLTDFFSYSSIYQKQIDVDISYLKPGQLLFEQTTTTVRGIVEIEQASLERQHLQELRTKDEADKKRDRQLQDTIYIATVGLGTGAIMASTSGLLIAGSKDGEITVRSPDASLPFHAFSIGFGLSILTGVTFGVAVWKWREFIQNHRERSAIKTLTAFIQLLTTEPEVFSGNDREKLKELAATLPNDVQVISETIVAWCNSNNFKAHQRLLELRNKLGINTEIKSHFKKKLLKSISHL